MSAEIRQIEDIIELPVGSKIVDVKVKRLTAPGENYGSLMLSVDLTIVNTNGSTKELNVIAKKIPPNEFLQSVFNTPVSFRNEIAFYKIVIPTLQNFQRESGVQELDFAPKYYGGRLNLSNGDQVDSDAVLILENLKTAKYVTLDRQSGLDLDAAKLVLKNLAKFHAVPLALKLKNKDIFERNVKPYLTPFRSSETHHNNKKNNLARSIDQIEELKTMKERILIGYDQQIKKPAVSEPWGTVVHNDLWTNNNMFKLDGDSPIKSIMVDFQACSYDTPANDLLFFLFSSVKNHVLEKHYDELVKFYHENFMKILAEFKCDTTPFNFDKFKEEIEITGRAQFGHVVFMIFPIYGPHDNVEDISEITAEMFARKKVTDLHKDKFIFCVNEFVRRNWI